MYFPNSEIIFNSIIMKRGYLINFLLLLVFSSKLFAQTELINNGNFNSTNSYWNKTGNFQYDSRFNTFNSSPGYAYLSDFSGKKTNNISGTLYQDFYVPASTSSLTISFWYRITTDEVTQAFRFDTCSIKFIDPSNTNNFTLLTTLSNLNYNSAYTKATITFPLVASQTAKNWQIQFAGYVDATYPTVFRFDDVSIIANQPINYSCISWASNIHPSSLIDSAMQDLCGNGIIPNNQNAATLNNNISKLDLAKYLSIALLGNTEPTFMDYFPNIYPSLQSLSITDQRYIKLMLYLEYEDKVAPLTGTDNVSPFPRDYFYTNFNSSLKKSDAIKAMLETWNLAPSTIYFDPTLNTYSPTICDMPRSYKNLPWIERANPLGIMNGIIASPCGVTSVNFGIDDNITYAQFYVMLSRLMKIRRPNIGYDAFFVPNLFYINNINSDVSLEKGVFHEYSENGFKIPSGGFALEFQHSYHSNLTEIPFLNQDTITENNYLKPKLQPLGGGWTHSYSMFIRPLSNASGSTDRLLIYWPDGTVQSFLVLQNKYETKGITDKLIIDSFNINNQPLKVRISKGRTIYTFRNIDPVSYNVLSIIKISDAHNNVLDLGYIDGYSTISGFAPKILSRVTDSLSGRSLNLIYWNNTNYLKNVIDPIGRTLTFYTNRYYHSLDSFADAKTNKTKYWYDEKVGTFAYPTHLLSQIQKPKGNYINNYYYSRKLKQTQGANYVININAVPDYRTLWTQQVSNVSKTQNNQILNINYSFDISGNITNTTTSIDSIRCTYDTATNRILIKRDLRLGFITKYQYDDNGFLNKQVVIDSLFTDSIKYEYTNNTFGEPINIKDYNDPYWGVKETRIERNSHGDPTTVVTNEGYVGEIRHKYYYYSNGLLASYISPTGFQSNFSYNNFGNLNLVNKYSQSFSNSLDEKYYYDAVSRLIGHSDFNGNTISYSYDNNDNLITTSSDTTGLQLKTQYTYDANENLLTTTSPKGHVTSLTYDFYTDDLLEENDGTNKKRWKYNEDGSLDSFITKNNTVFKYQYYNQTLTPGVPLDGLLLTDGYTSFAYRNDTKILWHVVNNGKGNVLSNIGASRGKWNKCNYPYTENYFNGPVNDNIYYEWDNLGRPTVTVYPGFGGKDFNYGYSYDFTTKNLEKLYNRNTNDIYVTYTYQKDGNPLKTVYGNGDTIYYHYDSYNRLDSIKGVNKLSQVLYSIGATLDKNGKHLSENTQIIYQGQPDITLPYLVTGTKSFTYQIRNRINTGDGKSYTSDGSGEITNSTNPAITYTWNQYSQLTNINRNGVDHPYEYDPLGNRKRNGNTYYVVDQQNTGNVVLEATQNTTPTNAYIYGNGLIARVDPINDSLFYYHFDFRGSVIAITDQNGVLVKYYKYEPSGNVYKGGGSLTWNNPFQYLGRHGVQTDDSDIYYMKARYYQPSTGRFLSEDPLWNTNLFVYGGDDAINNIDPNGEDWITYMPALGPGRDAINSFKQGNSTQFGLNIAFLALDVITLGEDAIIRDAVEIGAKKSGAYLLEFESGKFYAGKGLESRMNFSVKKLEKQYGDKLIKKTFYSTSNEKEGFKLEHKLMMKRGGPKSFDKSSPTYNQIFSPGKNY